MRILSCLVRFAVSLVLFAAAPVFAQTNYTTNITAAKINAAGGPLPYATVCAFAADIYGNPINVSAPTWGLLLKGTPAGCEPVVAGALATPLSVPDAYHTDASGPIYYNISIQQTNSTGTPIAQNIVFTSVANITGATWALDAYAPTSNTPITPSSVITVASAAPGSCTSPSIYLPSSPGILPAYCLNGVYVYFSANDSILASNNVFTGVNTVPTPPFGSSTNQIANMAALSAGLAGVAAGSVPPAQNFDCSNATIYASVMACLTAAEAYATTNESGSGLAARVMVPQGTFTITPAIATMAVSSVAAASGGSTVYTGTFAACASNACVGLPFYFSGFALAANNSQGTTTAQYVASASTATTLTVNNPNGVVDTTGSVFSPYQLTNGVQITGVMPRIESIPGTMPDLNMILNGGTVFNCGGYPVCFSGHNGRGIWLKNLAFTNYTGYALDFGSPMTDGLAFSNLDNLYAIGSATLNGTFGAWRFVNIAHDQIDRLFAYHVQQGLNLTAWNNTSDYGNLTLNDLYVYTYPKSAANGNNTTPGSIIQILAPTSGTASRLNSIDVPRFQVNSYSGDGTATNLAVNGLSSSRQIIGLNMPNMDIEGNNLYGVTTTNLFLSHIGLGTNVTNTYDLQVGAGVVQNIFECTTNCKISPGTANAWNAFMGMFSNAPTYNSMQMIGGWVNYTTAQYVIGNGLWQDGLGNGGPPITAGAFISSGYSKAALSGTCAEASQLGGGSAGSFTTTSSATCTVIITPHVESVNVAAPNGWSCWLNDETTPANKFTQTAHSTASGTMTGTPTSGDLLSFGCMGY
jgi:hypothetical protein